MRDRVESLPGPSRLPRVDRDDATMLRNIVAALLLIIVFAGTLGLAVRVFLFAAGWGG